jgi:heme oxygenase
MPEIDTELQTTILPRRSNDLKSTVRKHLLSVDLIIMLSSIQTKQNSDKTLFVAHLESLAKAVSL